MTVQTSANKTIVTGDGVTTQFNFGFVGVAAAYIGVIFTDASGNETVLTQGAGTTQYQISLNAPVTGAIWGLGGTITYDPNGTPIAIGTTLTIFRTLPLTQAISLQNQISLSSLGNGAETGLDLGTMVSQQIAETIGRAIVAPIVDATPPAPLPPIAQRANQGAAFDGSGNLIAGVLPSSGVISTAMQPVVDAATLALARTAFGLGTMAQEGIGAGLQDDGSGNARVITLPVAVATNQAVDKTFHLKQYAATGPINFTLARGNTLFPGFGFFVWALPGVAANAITFVPDSHDNFLGQSSGVSFIIPPGSSIFIYTDGAASGVWYYHRLTTAEPTYTRLLSGSSTYTTKLGCTRLKVRQVGGGGGGGPSGGSPTSSSNGGQTTFGSTTANGGGAGSATNTAPPGAQGIGGTGGTTGTGTEILRIPGSNGAIGTTGIAALAGSGGVGGCGPFGGGAGNVQAGQPNSGSGGGGANSSSASVGGGGGGASGEYVEFEIIAPAATYPYTVGAAGAAGTGTNPGTAGGSGAIYLEEFYD